MSKVIDLVGRRFGSWLVLHNTGREEAAIFFGVACAIVVPKEMSQEVTYETASQNLVVVRRAREYPKCLVYTG